MPDKKVKLQLVGIDGNAFSIYDACVFFDDAIHEYRVSMRPRGAKWWTNIGTAGHPWLSESERLERASLAIARAVKAGVPL
jgi:hypothetical protein